VLDLSTDGAYRWGAFYYTGKGSTAACEHRVKGLALAGDELIVLQQGHPGVGNLDRYAGYWYQANDNTLDFPAGDGSQRLADQSLSVSSKLAGATVAPLENGTLHDLAIGASWQAAPSDVVLDDAKARTASAGHTHALIQRVKVAGN
jgi:hypothetical protein